MKDNRDLDESQDEFYAPPMAHVLKKSSSYTSFVAGLFGAIVAVGASGIVSMILTLFAYRIYLNFGGDIQNLYYGVYGSHLFNLLAIGFSVPCDVFGGYVAARVGHSDPYRAALVCAIAIVFFSCLVFLLPYPLPNPTWSIVVGFIVIIPTCMYGANIYLRASEQSQRQE